MLSSKAARGFLVATDVFIFLLEQVITFYLSIKSRILELSDGNRNTTPEKSRDGSNVHESFVSSLL